MLVGTFVKGQGAPGVLNLIYLPMAFLSGLWFPLKVLPGALQQLAPIWPSYHLSRFAMDAVGFPQEGLALHAAILLTVTGVLLWMAIRRLRRVG